MNGWDIILGSRGLMIQIQSMSITSPNLHQVVVIMLFQQLPLPLMIVYCFMG